MGGLEKNGFGCGREAVCNTGKRRQRGEKNFSFNALRC